MRIGLTIYYIKNEFPFYSVSIVFIQNLRNRKLSPEKNVLQLDSAYNRSSIFFLLIRTETLKNWII